MLWRLNTLKESVDMETNTLIWVCCLKKSNLMEDKRNCKLGAEGTHLLENQRVEPQMAHPTSETPPVKPTNGTPKGKSFCKSLTTENSPNYFDAILRHVCSVIRST